MNKAKKVFDKILKKDNYTRQEVGEILLGTYEGFTAAWLKKHPAAMIKAKKKVFDKIEKLKLNYQGSHKIIDEEDYQRLKEEELNTSNTEKLKEGENGN